MFFFLLAISIALASWLFYKKPTAGLVLLFVSLPFERLGSFNITSGMNIKPVQVIGVALVVAACARIFFKQDKLRGLAITRWLLALAVWAVVPVAILNYAPLWQDYVSTIFVLVLCWSVAQLVNPTRFVVLAKAIMLAAIALGCFGIYQLVGDALDLSTSLTGLREGYTHAQFGFARIHGPASEPLFYASYLLLPLLVSLGYFLTSTSKKMLALASLAFALTAINLGLSVSKGGILAATVGTIVLFTFLYKRGLVKPRRLGPLLAAVVLVVILGVAGLGFASTRTHGSFGKGFEIFFDVSFDSNNASYQERFDSTQTGFDLFAEEPLAGIGVGGVGYQLQGYPQTPGQRIALNNYYLEVLVELGVVGLFLFFGLVLSALVGVVKTAWKAKVQLAVPAAVTASLLVALLLQLVSYSGFFISYIWVVLGLASGLAGNNGLFNRGKP